MDNSTIKLPFVLDPFRERLEATVKPYVQIQTQICEEATLWQSKILGRPYFPKSANFPSTSKGKPLYLLAQINFAEVPLLPDFPSKGILQFYLANTDLYGADFNNPTHQDGFRVMYHADPERDESKLVSDFSFMPSPWEENDDWMPFTVFSKYLKKPNSCLALTFQRKEMPMSPQDYLHESLVGCDVFALSNDEGESDREIETYYHAFDGHRLGGYPAFTQADPRSYITQEEEPYSLLLQVDSEDNNKIDIMWGDTGTCNFFIKPSALARLDFSDVLYNWDCC